jgi:CheY-like chemotaxis protein
MAEVLVVEDDEITRVLLESRLFNAGHRVHTASSVAEAHAVFRRGGAPDLVVSDMFMPGGSGLNLVASLREDPACAGVPVVFLSGRALPGDVEAARALGGTYLTKPFTMAELTEAIEGALGDGDAVLERAVREHLAGLGDLGDVAEREMFAHLLTLFVDGAPVLLADLERAVAAQDAALVETCAHRLAGSAANLGAEPLARWCAQVETWGRQAAAEPTPGPLPPTVMAALRRELATTCRVFSALTQGLAPAQP